MIDYNAFHSYLVEMVTLYQRTRSTKGMSQLAAKWHCTSLTRDQFYQMKLDRLEPGQVTPQLSRVVRDTIGRSEAKQTLLDTIGALNEGILAGSRISQGSDRTVQITITQPMQPVQPAAQPAAPTVASNAGAAAPIPSARPSGTLATDRDARRGGAGVGPVSSDPVTATQGFSGRLPLYKPGQVLYHKGSGELFLVSRLLDHDRLTYRYTLGNPRYSNQAIGDMAETTSFWLGNGQLRPAKGSEVARFLGALTRSGYEWTADNANGLFFVKPRQQERKPVEVFANELPDGCRTIYALPAVAPSPYRYALLVESPVDFAHDYMTDRRSTYPAQTNAILRQMRQAVGSDVAHGGFDSIRDYYEYTLPSLCSAYSDGSMREHTVALVKDSNNGTTYWLARDRDVLRLLAWVAYII